MRTTEMEILKSGEDSCQNIKDRDSINIDTPMGEKLIDKNKEKLESKSKKKYIIIGLILFLTILLIGAGVGIYFLFFRKAKTEQYLEYSEEDLVVDIKYKTDMIYRYNLRKTTEMKVNGDSIDNGNNSRNIEQLSDFLLIIRKENIEKNDNNLTSKKWFSGYLSLLNISLINETGVIQIIYDKILNNIINNINETRDLNEDISFVKIDFYENGEIKNIYYPKKNFSLSNMEFIKEYSKLIIPKISSNLYTHNISQTLNDLIEKDKNKNKNKKYYRNLKEEKENEKDLFFYNTKKVYKFESNQSEDFEVEEYLVPPTEESINYDLREKNNCTNCQNINLTEFSMENIENKEVNLKNSILNKTIYTSINNEGILESVTEIETALITNEKEEEEIIEDYKSNITFDIDEMYFETISQLNLSDYFIDENLNKILYDYFDKFSYILFNETYYNEYLQETIKENILNKNNSKNDEIITEVTEINENNLRKTSITSNTYYGMSKLINEKDLYNYNFLGLKMQKKIFNELDPFTGKITSYFNLIFGNINRKIKTS